MATEINSIANWIPVIGTLLGASIGFTASFLIAKFTKAKDEAVARENRDRERIEKIYRLLVTINSEKTRDMTDVINHIHQAIPIKQKDVPGFPPLIELEMLINLYFPSLEPQRLELMKVVYVFGAEFIEFRFKDYRSESLEKRQKDSGTLAALSSKIGKQVKAMQQNLVEHVKA